MCEATEAAQASGEDSMEKPKWWPLLINIPLDEEGPGEAMLQLVAQTAELAAEGYVPTGIPAMAAGGGAARVTLFQWFVLADDDGPVNPEDDDEGDMG